ncbi:hypothetical protein N7462_002621 [Penicillium macrosclerotiorum]|uniref:uncharacterized protein n=1 Tax=Penicillium macrosclerotiorum TaxID=303699 RepID=UPI002548EAC6|nr:uncharacterized protein N7462_002621 [Penicillium macrosclerotiorum]KAJ5693198.1 hypothetical protein N7462_002621 [Penicillium macrosclerotiorum]
MSYTSYSDARMSHQSSSKYRTSLRPPDREVALRRESIVTSKTELVLKPQGNPESAIAYKVVDEDGIPVYTVTGRKYDNRACREFRDASGLPLFDLHRKAAFSIPYRWYITMPGADERIAEAEPRLAGSTKSLKFSFQNMAAIDLKTDTDRELTLQVVRQGEALVLLDVIDGDRRVAEINESIRHNERLFLTRGSKRGLRQAMDLVIVSGIDSSLVSIWNNYNYFSAAIN